MKVNTTIHKIAKLPYKQVRGSVEVRRQKETQLTNKIFNELVGTIDDNGISMSKFNKILKKLLPQNLNIYTRKLKEDGYEAQLDYFYNDKCEVIGYELLLQVDKKKRIKKSYIPTIMHELQHLANALYYPKIVAREERLAKSNLATNKFHKLFEEEIYQQEDFGGKKDKRKIVKSVKYKILKFLKHKAIEEKIDYLQNLRQSLLDENSAYQAEYKYAKRMVKRKIDIEKSEKKNLSTEFLLEEKIKLLNDMLFKIITKERKNIAIKRTNTRKHKQKAI